MMTPIKRKGAKAQRRKGKIDKPLSSILSPLVPHGARRSNAVARFDSHHTFALALAVI